MVRLKYSALYTDDLGCEQATVHFSNGEFQLTVRDCTFKNDSLNFDFSAMNYNKSKQLFYLKDDELMECVIDIKIPLTLVYKNKYCIEEFLLRIERHGNYYNNSLLLYLNGVSYNSEGYDLKELISNMNKKLPKEYDMKHSFLCIFATHYFEENEENVFYNLTEFEVELKIGFKKNSYDNLFNSGYKKKLEKLQKIPITYIGDKCYYSRF